MKVESYEGSRQRKILIGMITNKAILGRIAARFHPRLFAAKWCNFIAEWCIDYYRQYHKAPKRQIESLFATWAEGRGRKDETVDLVESFLSDLSREYEEAGGQNVEYVMKIADVYFNHVRAGNLAERIQGHLSNSEVDKAMAAIASFAKVDLQVDQRHADLFDEKKLEEAFQDRSECLVEYQGALGQFFQDRLTRDNLVAFQAPEKSGKSFWLLDIAWRGMLQRRRVVYFEAGDMSEGQVRRRFYTRAAKHPFRSPNGKWPCVVHWPTGIEFTKGDDTAEVTFKEKTFERRLDKDQAQEALRRVTREDIRSKKSFFKLFAYPNSTLGIDEIKAQLNILSLDNWLPDIIIVDYIDIMAPPPGKMESRDQINTNWKRLRGLSQEYHCLVVTATQSDADSYERKTQDRRNFSEDKRKLGHVAGMIGINITPEERERRICRLNWIGAREGEYDSRRCCHIAQCLALSNPAVRSCW